MYIPVHLICLLSTRSWRDRMKSKSAEWTPIGELPCRRTVYLRDASAASMNYGHLASSPMSCSVSRDLWSAPWLQPITCSLSSNDQSLTCRFRPSDLACSSRQLRDFSDVSRLAYQVAEWSPFNGSSVNYDILFSLRPTLAAVERYKLTSWLKQCPKCDWTLTNIVLLHCRHDKFILSWVVTAIVRISRNAFTSSGRSSCPRVHFSWPDPIQSNPIRQIQVATRPTDTKVLTDLAWPTYYVDKSQE